MLLAQVSMITCSACFVLRMAMLIVKQLSVQIGRARIKSIRRACVSLSACTRILARVISQRITSLTCQCVGCVVCTDTHQRRHEVDTSSGCAPHVQIHDWFIGKPDPLMLFTLKWFALSDLVA